MPDGAIALTVSVCEVGHLGVAENLSDGVRDVQDLAAARVDDEQKSGVGHRAKDLENKIDKFQSQLSTSRAQ